ncbi:NADH oxidase [Microdochium trichocladiopsis]|uniref:NADH oxidase n=1 Tax=Microdochium trichocladiopsis TaxID=1682393 RepID=A0A9P8YHQ1_9PEZI|nr:NADH oxidase [Microdochium trichocladiopsis]KAH7038153.1 NADH oxidase [Microdochium trichocladiopsis]
MAPKRFEWEGSQNVDPAPLGQPLQFEFSGKTAPNRFLKAAMTERLSTWDPKDLPKRGIPTDELVNVYQRWGEGGLGVILSGNIMIDYDQLEAAGNPIVAPASDPEQRKFEGPRFEGFKRLAEASKAHGSLIVAQVSHPGRQVPEMINPHPVSASDIQLVSKAMGMTFGKPRAMTQEDIDQVVEGFAFAAEYLHKAGFDGIELHGAHGYLLAQFLSQTTNKRTDKYGGSLQNRARIIFEISDAIRKRVPDKSFSVSIKLNSVEFQDGGITPDECKDLCVDLEKHGFDFVELSGGTYQSLGFKHARESTKKREAFFIEFAESIRPNLHKTKVYVTGGLRSTGAMVEALQSVDGVGMARPVTHEFDLGRKILEDKVPGAIETLLDESDFGITNVAAGTQMRLVGRGKEPLDLSREDHLGVFKQSMGKWGKGMQDNADNSKYGFVDVDGIELAPYGTPYAAAA